MDTQTVAVNLPTDVIYVTGKVNGVEYTWTNTDANRWEAVVARTETEIYVVVLELINALGTTYSASLTIYYGTLSLVFDRTEQDVERWRLLHSKGWAAMSDDEKAQWQTALKGAYNYVDLNRVESAVAFISNRLIEAGYLVAPDIRSVWRINDHPTKADMDRYFENIAMLRSALPAVYPTTPEAPTTQKKMDYQVANDIEHILSDVDRLITSVRQSWYYAGDVFTGEI